MNVPYDPARHFTSDLSYKVFLDRYTTKDIERRFEVGDVALALVVDDSQWPRKEVARVLTVDDDRLELEVMTGPEKGERLWRDRAACDRPTETTPEDMWRRVARALTGVEKPELQSLWEGRFFEALSDWRFVPGGRILAGSGAGNLTLYNCVAAETVVHTKDGLRPIGTLSGPVEILTQGGVYRTATFGSYGVQRLFRVLLDNGDTIDATEGHEWIATTPGGGTEVVTTLGLEGRRIPVQPPAKPAMDPAGVAHGLVFGHGSRHNRLDDAVLDLTGASAELLPWVAPYAQSIRPHRRGVRAYGMPRPWQELPAEEAGGSYWRGFIVGLLAAHGSVDTRGDVVVTQSRVEVLEAVRRHASEAGFVASATRSLRMVSNFGPDDGPSHALELHHACVRPEDLLVSAHRERLQGRGPGAATIGVASVTPTERVEEVFCCNEPQTHTMVVGQGYLTRQCYVVPSPQDSRQGIIETLGQMIEIMSRGGGVGINVSSLRPRRSVVRGVNGRSSGAVSWMDLYSRATGLVEQGGCFGPDERIATDKGLIAAAELFERMGRGESFRADTHEGLRPIVARFRNGTKRLYRVTTRRGLLVEVTAAHKMGVLRRGAVATVPLEQLSVGDEVLTLLGAGVAAEAVALQPVACAEPTMSTRRNEQVRLPGRLDARLAYVVGYMHGDGYVDADKTATRQAATAVKMATADDRPEIRERLVAWCRDLFGVEPVVEPGDGAFHNVAIHSRTVVEWLARNGMLKAQSDTVRLPEAVFRSPSDVMGAFVAGYFDADGCDRGREGGHGMDSTSLGMLRDLQQLFGANGIASHIHTTDRSATGWQTIYRLAVTGSGFRARFTRFAPLSLKAARRPGLRRHFARHPREVWPTLVVGARYRQGPGGSTNDRVSLRYRVAAAGNRSTVAVIDRTLRLLPDEIVGIEPSVACEVYDFEVAGTHMLSGNGIYTSNSRRGALMLMLYDWHPDILRFIDAKRTPGMVENANISVCVSDAFMQAVKEDLEWELRFPDTDDPDYDRLWNGDLDAWLAAGKPVNTYDRRPAREIWQRLTESAWASAEPGIAFLDRSNKQSNSWYFHPLIATNPCVTGDTLVYTADGLHRADELYLSKAPVEAVVDGRMKGGRTEAASPVFLTGLKAVVRLVTREGYAVRVTSDHQIYSDERGWVKAGELRRGEAVRILDHPGGFGTEGSEDLGQVLGYMSVAARRRGDTLRVSFAPERQSELEPLLTASVRRLSGADEDGDATATPQRRSRTAALVAHQLGEIAYQHGVGVGLPTVPDAVMRGSEAMQRGYLQGVFEAAGYLSTARSRPVLTARGPAGLLRGVQQILLNLGMASRLRTAKGREEDDAVPAFLAVEREGLLRFVALVGAVSSTRRGALADAAAELRRHPLSPERYVAHVEQVTPDGEEPVFDLTEPQTHSFVAGGLVVHNCAEQPLPAWGVCCLGHVNLARFVEDGQIDWDGLGRTVRYAVRFLDNVVDTTPYYFEENAETQKGERRLGLGTMGLGEVLIRLGLRYGSPEAVELIDRMYGFVAHEAYAASADLAEEKGAFPYFDVDRFLQSGFMQGMPEEIRERVRAKGIRNVTLLTQAPTGCVAPDTLVRADGALKAIATLGDPGGVQWQEIDAQVQTDGTAAKASHFYINGQRPVATLRTRHGYRLTATLNHRVRVIDAAGEYVWRQVGEVQPGDLVVLRRDGIGDGEGVDLRPVSAGSRAVAPLPGRMTPALAEILGHYMGAGYLKRRGGLHLVVAKQDPDVRDALQAALSRVFGNPHVAVEDRPGCWVLGMTGYHVTRFMHENGMAKAGASHGAGAASAFIPAAVLESGATSVAAFLRGLFEADATVTRFHVSFATVSETLALQVQQALLGLGILSAMREVSAGKGRQGMRARYSVRLLNGREVARFRERVDFLGARKRGRLRDGRAQWAWGESIPNVPLCERFYEAAKGLGTAVRQDIAGRLGNGALNAEYVRTMAAAYPQLADTTLARMLAEGLFFETVKSVALGSSPTYDLTVPGNHTYVANGFVCHNTVGTMVGTSTGIEPFYALKYTRQSRLGVDEQYVHVAEEWLRDHPGESLPEYFVGAMDLSPDEHVRVQAAAQRWTDSAISKTANAPADYSVDDTRRLYELAYDLGCKGVTIYRDQSRQVQVLHRSEEDKAKDGAAQAGTPAAVADSGPALAKRPRRMRGECFLVPTHFGNLTLDVHEDPQSGEPVEIIASAGTAGSDLMADAVALGMAASVLLRLKGPVSKRERLEIIVDKFRNIGGSRNGTGGLGAAASLAQGIARGLEQYIQSADQRGAEAVPLASEPTLPAVVADLGAAAHSKAGRDADFDLCPSCGGYSMEMVEGCRTCHACGFSNCS